MILKAIEKDRQLRYQHAADIRADVQELRRETDSTRPAVREEPSPVSRVRRWKLRVPAVAVLAAILAVGGYRLTRTPATLTNKDTIVLADFENKTGDPVFDDTKILDHRGIAGGDPIAALAHLQLGRAFVLSGDASKAKAAYQQFLTRWNDADPNVPILKQARAEYAKLQ